MATKAEQARAKAQRNANPPKAPAPKRARRDVDVDTSLPGVSATDRKSGKAGERNLSERAAKKGGAVIEVSETARPSRKSTRRAVGGAKTSTALEKRAVATLTSPKARATRASVKKAAPAKAAAKPPARVKK